MVMLHIKLKKIYMQQHGSKYFACRHTIDPGVGSKHFFSESSHVAYQIKGNGAYSTMQAHHTPLVLGVGSKGQHIFFEK